MPGKWLFLNAFLLFACVEDKFPTALYNYQVERLLSGGDVKVWLLTSETSQGVTINPSICSDSLRLLIVKTSADSIDISKLIPTINCAVFDTLKLGKANASGNLVFTDSLSFESGENWVVQSITSQHFSVFTSENKLEVFLFE